MLVIPIVLVFVAVVLGIYVIIMAAEDDYE